MTPAQRKRLDDLAAKKARREAKAQSKGKPMSEEQIVAGVMLSKLRRINRDIDSARQEKDDSNANHASAWKGAKNAGANVDALKLFHKLNRQATDKRNDFLKAWGELTASPICAHWFAQPDMFETLPPEPERRNDQGAPWPMMDDEDREDEDTGPAELNFTSPGYAEDEDEETGPEAERVAEPLNVDDQAGAGHAFNEGKNAGLAGVGPEANPFEDGSTAADQWEAGRVAAAEVAEEVDQYNLGWAAHKAGAERDSHGLDGEAAERWLQGWDDRQIREDRKAAQAAKTDEEQAA